MSFSILGKCKELEEERPEFYEDLNLIPLIKEMQELLTDKLSPNVKKSHELLEKAVEINGNDYRSLYELGCDYMSHGKRGTTYNRNKAKELLEKAELLAKANNDQRYLSLINKRLRHL